MLHDKIKQQYICKIQIDVQSLIDVQSSNRRTIKYIGIFVIKSLESGLVPPPSLLQKHSLTGVKSFEVYVSDVIGRRFEKVKTDHVFENWTPINVDKILLCLGVLLL
jgi:hypothetical protein